VVIVFAVCAGYGSGGSSVSRRSGGSAAKIALPIAVACAGTAAPTDACMRRACTPSKIAAYTIVPRRSRARLTVSPVDARSSAMAGAASRSTEEVSDRSASARTAWPSR